MKHGPASQRLPETAAILREVHASEPLWVTMVRLSVGAAVVLGLTVGAVVVNEAADTQRTAKRTAQHARVAANGY